MLILDHIQLKIGSTTIIQDISLQIAGGEFVVLTGPSGAGKSSIISLLLGKLRANQGKISIDNIDISRLPSSLLQFYRRRLGVVFQDYKLLPQKTVSENIAFALRSCGDDPATVRQRVQTVIAEVNLTGKENRYPHELSGGEQQRVSIARAIVHQPKLFLADEPTGNLDRANANEIIEILKKINQNGSTVILTTHDEKVVENLGVRTICLEHGRVISDSTPTPESTLT